ncbi:MAG: protein kinase [Kiritimatiellia bacterium]
MKLGRPKLRNNPAESEPGKSDPEVRADSTVAEAAAPLEQPPASGMTMKQLMVNYKAIVQANAIFYPSAFHFQKEFGRGRQGIVFLSLRQGARGCITEHAIKLYDPSLYRNTEEYWTDMGRIAMQISRLQRLQSPNLVSRHSYEETHGIGYAQMEAVDGINLLHFMKPEHITVARANSTEQEWKTFTGTLFAAIDNHIALRPGVVVYILRNILRGVERLHAMGFLHFDIKPGNIMIDRLGMVKVVDFGRAVMAGEQLSFLLGSPMYMAPEIHMRKPGRFQSDFFSLGLVGLEMLRGRRLTDDEEVGEEELLKLKQELPQRLPSMLPPSVLKNDYLVSILRKFLDPDSQKRHTSAKEADAGSDGLKEVDRQFLQAGVDTEYPRVLSDYLAKLVDRKTDRIEDAAQGK